MNLVQSLQNHQLKDKVPEMNPGDTVRVQVKIKEGDKERIQKYEGLVISRRGGQGLSATITVRKIAEGVGVERIFPLHSPLISKIEVVKQAKVKRAKLYYVKGYQKKLKDKAVK